MEQVLVYSIAFAPSNQLPHEGKSKKEGKINGDEARKHTRSLPAGRLGLAQRTTKIADRA